MSKPNRKYIGTTGLDFLGENDEVAPAVRPDAPTPPAERTPISKAPPTPPVTKAAPDPIEASVPKKATSDISAPPANLAPSALAEAVNVTAKVPKAKKSPQEAKLSLVARRASGVPSDTAGFERTTYWMDPHLKLRIQEKAYWERMQIFQVVNMIVEDYFKRHPVKQAQ